MMLPAENIYICIKHLYFSEIQISNTVVATCCKEEGVGKGSGVEAKKKRKQNNKFIKQKQLDSNLDNLFLKVRVFLEHRIEAGES